MPRRASADDDFTMTIRDPSETSSKSRRKRERQALQAFGEALVRLPPAALARIPLDARLRAEVDLAGGLRRAAYRRQIRYIARLLNAADEADLQVLRAALGGEHGADSRHAVRERRVVRWGERLMEEGDAALVELFAEHPGLDRQRLRQALRAAAREQAGERRGRGWRSLLAYLRELDVALESVEGIKSFPPKVQGS